MVFDAVLDYALLKPGTVAAATRCRRTRAWSLAWRRPRSRSGRSPGARGHGQVHPEAEGPGRRRAATLNGRSPAIVADARARSSASRGSASPLPPRRPTRPTPPADRHRRGGLGRPCRALRARPSALHGGDRAPGDPHQRRRDDGRRADRAGIQPEETTGLAILSTMPGVIAHISEELRARRPIRTVPDQDQLRATLLAVSCVRRPIGGRGGPTIGSGHRGGLRHRKAIALGLRRAGRCRARRRTFVAPDRRGRRGVVGGGRGARPHRGRHRLLRRGGAHRRRGRRRRGVGDGQRGGASSTATPASTETSPSCGTVIDVNPDRLLQRLPGRREAGSRGSSRSG